MRFSRCYLEITNRCNLACSFCPKTKRPARTLTAEEFRLLAGKLTVYNWMEGYPGRMHSF